MRKNKIISILIIFVILSSYLPAMLNIVNAVEETQKINAEEITANSFENERLGQYILENYDTDKDGILSDLEIEEITDLELDFSEKNKEEVATRQEQNEEIPLEEDKEGISLQGIQNLTNLQKINLIGNFTNYAILDELEKLEEVHIKNTSLKTENIKILKGKTQEIELPEILKSAFNPESKLYIGEDAKFNLISSDETREPCISLNDDKTAIVIDTTNANIGENEDLIIFDEKDEDCKLAGTTISVKFEVYEEEANKDDNAENKEENATENEVVDNTVKEEQIPEADQNLLMQAKTQEPQVTYQAHVGNVGWMNSVQSEQTAGLAGSGNDLEALKISLVNASGNAHIKYQAHVSNVGWQSYVQDGSQAGTTGESKPIEAVRIKLEGITGYSVEYRTYVKNQGWQQWVSDGVTAGTTGQSTTIEAIQIRIVKTEELQPSKPEIAYSGHVSGIGWMSHAHNGETAGVVGSENLEAIRIELVNTSETAHIKYQAHVSNVGWQNYVQDGSQAGTTGESKPIEAIRIKLEGIPGYSVEYRAYVKNQGWQQWVSEGVTAGTTGQSTTIQAIQIRIVKTEQLQPSKPEIAYSGHVSEVGWMSHAHNGETAGVVGSENLEAIRIELVNTSETAHIKYQAHVSNVGWQSYVQDGSQAGTTGESKPIEAIRIKLEGIQGYSVEYRAYVKNQGWQQWVSDGVAAGTTGQSTTIQAIQIRIVKTEELQPSKPEIAYSGHVSKVGWMSHAHNGETAGIEGSNNLEAIRIELVNTSETAHIKYQVHVSDVGWMSPVQDGSDGGVTGQSKAIEAIRINLEGIPGYSVEYRAYVRGQGWQAWAADGMTAGTEGQSTTIQAIQIRIVKTEDTVVPKVQYSGYVNNTWTSSVSNEETLGVIGSNLEGIKINLVNADENAHIKYTPHVKDIGWRDTVQDGEVAGITGQNLGLEALRIELEGLDGYSIEYRAYVQGQGWQDWVSDGLTAGTTGKSLQIQAIQIRIAIKFKKKNTSNFANIDESKYPGFKQKLQQLQNQHPNWILTIKYTGLDWNAVLNGEDVLVNGQPKSLTQNTNQWINGNTEYGTGWRRASREAIAYMMDPRNSLDETYIFQFQDLTSIAGTYDDIANMIEGSFLTKYPTSSTDSIINAILSSSRTYNVSPYHLVSRMLQEQGNDGSALNGYTYNGRIVYNLFNIGATGSTDAEIIQNGAKYAYDKHWFTPETCILGSARFLNSGYLSKGQTTLYFQKFNVVNAPYFENQYMQNIRAANDEGARISNEYKENGLINGEFEFVIPVYENMPATAVPRPIG